MTKIALRSFQNLFETPKMSCAHLLSVPKYEARGQYEL